MNFILKCCSMIVIGIFTINTGFSASMVGYPTEEACQHMCPFGTCSKVERNLGYPCHVVNTDS